MGLNKNFFSIKEKITRHGFFTRLDGFSKKKEFKSLNCSLSNGDDKKRIYKNRVKTLKKLNLNKKKLVLVNQTHSSKVIKINKNNMNKALEADGMITSLNDVVLGVLTADCAPVFIYDKKGKYVCCLHSGWKGTLSNISENAVKIFDKYNIQRDNLIAIIGPLVFFSNEHCKLIN